MAIIKQISNQTQPVQTIDTSEDFFNIDKTPLSIEQLIDAFEDLIIRFDNDPNYYTKKDYYYLLKYLGEIIRQLKNRADAEDLSNLNTLLQETISNLHKKQDKQSDNLETQAKTIEGAINELANKHYSNYIETDGQDEAYMSHAAYTSQIISKYGFKDGDWTIGKNSGTVWVYDNGKFNNFGLANKLTDFSNAINELNAWKGNSDSNIQSIKRDVETVTDRVTSNTEQISDLWDAIDNLPQGGSAPTYKEGSGIDIDENNVISAVTDQEIKATVAIGGYKAGDKIEVGTDITSVLKKLMTTVIGVVPVMPRLVIESQTFNREYGTALPNHSYTINLIPGYFKSEDSSKWDSTQLMDCRINWLDIDQQQTNIVNAEGTKAQVSIPSFQLINSRVIDGDDVNYEISANTEFPKNNIGETLNIQGYTGGSVEISGQITYSPYYNAFIGGIDVEGISELTSSNIRGVTSYQLNVTPTTKTLLSGQATSNNAKKAILIACPSVYKLISVQSELGTDMTDSFDVQGTVNVQCGEQSVPYNCYLCVVYGECKFQTVKLGKA